MTQNVKDHPEKATLVNTVVTTMAILECFNSQQKELSLTTICQQTGHHKSRIHRLCGTLVALGYLVKTSRSCYRLGPKLMILGKAYEKTNSLKEIAAPVMQELSQKTELSSTLYMIDGSRCVCLARELGPARFAYVINEGTFEELYTTAAGRVLLAYSDPGFAKEILEKAHPVRFTPSTITDMKKIELELEAIRQRGYAINNQERERGISAISAPIFGHGENITASLAVVGLAHRFEEDQIENLYSALKDATGKISYLLGEA